MMLPAPLQDLLDQIDACENAARAVLTPLTEGQVNWQPASGRWSIGQCLDHLRAINVFYVSGFLTLTERARDRASGGFTGLRPSWLARQFIASLEPPPRFRAKASKRVAPASRVRRDEVLAGFEASHEPYRALVRAAADVDVNRVTGPNPFFRLVPMSLAAVLLVIPAHDRRHLWQARQVRQHAAFPPA